MPRALIIILFVLPLLSAAGPHAKWDEGLISFTPVLPEAGSTVRFQTEKTAKEEGIYHWRFGDGSESNERRPLHVYEGMGEYEVTLSVTAGDRIQTSTVTVRVSPSIDDLCEEVVELNTAYFEESGVSIDSRIENLLSENLEVLLACPDMFVRVEGWATAGEHNPHVLSQQRAEAVSAFYLENGIAKSRLVQTVGLGKKGSNTLKGDAARQYRRADSIPLPLDCPEDPMTPFPRPVPEPSTRTELLTDLILDRFEEEGSRKTVEDIDQILKGALIEAGYQDPPLAYWSLPCGYAMATDLERINEDGTPHSLRWNPEVSKPIEYWKTEYNKNGFFSAVGAVLRDLTTGPDPYITRVMVFFVAPDPVLRHVLNSEHQVEADYTSVYAFVNDPNIRDRLDRRVRDIPVFDSTRDLGFRISAFVYEFSKPAGGNRFSFVAGDQPARPYPRISGSSHLYGAGLTNALNQILER